MIYFSSAFWQPRVKLSDSPVAIGVMADPHNAAERALRHGVMWRKSIGGTASERCSRFASRLLGVVATCRQRGRLVLEYLTSCFEASVRLQSIPLLLRP